MLNKLPKKGSKIFLVKLIQNPESAFVLNVFLFSKQFLNNPYTAHWRLTLWLLTQKN